MKLFSKYFLIFLILLFPFGQLTKIPIFQGSGSLYLHDILIALYILLNLNKHSLSSVLKALYEQKALTGFIVCTIVGLLLALSNLPILDVLISSLYLIRLLLYLLFFYFIRHKMKNSKVNFDTYITIGIIMTLVMGIGQYFLFPSLEPLFASGWDRHLNRLVGPWLDSGFTGLILLLQLLFLCSLIVKNTKNKLLNYILLLILLIALLLTYSRSSYLTLIVAGLLFLILNKTLKIIPLLIIGITVGIMLLPKTFGEGTKLLRTSTIESRFGSWQQGIIIFLEKPILGQGYNTLRYVKRDKGLELSKWQTSHSAAGFENSLIFLLACTGILGTSFFIVWIIKLLISNNQNSLILASIIGIGIHGMFANSWFYPWIILWMGIIMVNQKLKGVERF